MAWDSKRPIRWKQLLRLVGVFLLLFNLFLYFTSKNNYGLKVFGVSLISALFYLLFAVIMTKFGMDPLANRERRMAAIEARRAEKASGKASTTPTKGKKTIAGDRPRPPATSRTNASNRQVPRRK